MKTTVNLSNVFLQNESKLMSIIGNISLILAVIGAIPVTLGGTGIVLPALLIKLSTWALAGGSIIKLITKTFGTSDASGNPVNVQLPSTVGTVTPTPKA